MSKYKYRATDLQQVNWDRVREAVAGERVIVAVDVAKTDFMAALLKADRTVVAIVKWRHPHSTRAWVDRIVTLGSGRLEVVMEPSGTYGDALRYQLLKAGVEVYRMSPKRVHDAAEIYDGVPSLHDAKAACLIARLHLEGVSQRWLEAGTQRRELQARLKRLAWYQERAQRARNRLEAQLARHWPEVLEDWGLKSISLLRLLVDYGDASAVAADTEVAGERLRRWGGWRLKGEKIEALLTSAVTTVGVPAVAAERAVVQALAEELLTVEAACRELERSLEAAVREDAGLAHHAEAVGRVTAVVLRCALGDPRDYPDAASYAKAAGLNLKERSSGKHKGRLKLTKRGPGVARRYLYFAALRLIAHDGPARHWYEAKVARDGGLKGKAIAALMRKLSKALWHVGRGSDFEEAKLFEASSRAA